MKGFRRNLKFWMYVWGVPDNQSTKLRYGHEVGLYIVVFACALCRRRGAITGG